MVAGSECATASAWVIQWAPSLRAGGAAALVTVTEATRAVRNAGLAAAVLGARIGVRNAAVALVEMDRLRPRLADEAVQAVWEGFLQIATDHGPKEIRSLRDKLIAAHGHQGEFAVRQDQLKYGVCLSQPLDDDGMFEYRLRLDPEGKEVFEAMLGPLSAPKPTAPCSDLRSSDQRRGEALVEICRRAAARGEAPITTKAAVFVTVGLEDLRTRCGAGTTLSGQLLAMETIRAIACDAQIIPRGPGHGLGGPGRGPGQTVVHPRDVAGDVASGPGLHDPGLYGACVLGGRASPHPLGRWRAHQPAQRGAALRQASLDRPSEGLDRDRHHQRSDLAPLTAQPHSPPGPAG